MDPCRGVFIARNELGFWPNYPSEDDKGEEDESDDEDGDSSEDEDGDSDLSNEWLITVSCVEKLILNDWNCPDITT